MTPTLDAVLLSWPFDPWLLGGLLLTALVYLRGWLMLRRRDPGRWHGGQLVGFLGGLAAVFVALGSPIEPFASLLLQVHMTQHLLLMMAAPPLLWLGEPLFPLLRGLPRLLRTHVAAPLLRSPLLISLFTHLTHPLYAWLLFTAVTWLWHLPPTYELALQSPFWHHAQHICFLGAGLLFWYPVVRPYPARVRWSVWWLVPYLLLADVQNTVLSAVLAFSDRVLYPHYEQIPRLGGLPALDDQAAAGVLMWVPGSLAFLLPLFALSVRFLGSSPAVTQRQTSRPSPRKTGRISLPLLPPTPKTSFDLLKLPWIGRFLRWRHARTTLQLPLLLLAILIVLDGLFGPQVSPMNLAGVLPWIHWRGLLVLTLLIAGNFFCTACPFVLPRTLAGRWLPAGRPWPRWLRGKWLALVLLVLFLWAYEAFALWDSPWWTACIVLGYFMAAFAVDSVFRGASFCKHVCPIGQFNFVQSLVSPLEVKARDPVVCTGCRTRDCIRGRDDIPGCGLGLFLPRKAGNADCTFCLDCVHACPHDNVGIVAVAPTAELWHDRPRSGLGRFGRRPDLAALVVVLAFGAFVNAAGMVAPVVDWQERLGSALGLTRTLMTTLVYLVALLVLPAVAVLVTAAVAQWCGGLTTSRTAVATRYAYALVPLGFGMWLAHYGFHLWTGLDAFVPAAQRFAADLGMGLGAPHWVCACCRPVADWLLRAELLALDIGLLLSLYTAYRLAASELSTSRPLGTFLPWALLLVGLFAAGVWVMLQPMEMRGLLP